MAKFNFAPYQPATYCSHRAQPGDLHLAAFIEDQFPETRLLNIESCRDIVGGVTLSHHAEGRANDEGVPMTRQPSGVSVGYQIVELLGPHGKELGIDHIIANLAPWLGGRGQPRTWANAYPLGKPYTGLHPHKDHDHIGLTRVAARDLTLAKIRAVVLGVAPPVPIPPIVKIGDPMLGLNIGKMDDPPVSNEGVRTLQVMLKNRGFPALEVNGTAGGATRTAFHDWKIKVGITAATSGGDGKVGAYEYAALNPPK